MFFKKHPKINTNQMDHRTAVAESPSRSCMIQPDARMTPSHPQFVDCSWNIWDVKYKEDITFSILPPPYPITPLLSWSTIYQLIFFSVSDFVCPCPLSCFIPILLLVEVVHPSSSLQESTKREFVLGFEESNAFNYGWVCISLLSHFLPFSKFPK